ncbi:MAG: DNA-formamidopyrimidine glycosylase family protein [Actinomycetales bacterium]
MPEGDTVWLAARRLHDRMAGQVVSGSDFRWPSLATASVVGCVLTEVVPRGKHLLFRFDDGRTLHTHFRMDGSWHLYQHQERWRGGDAAQVRIVLRNADWVAVGYRLPVVDLLPTAEETSVVGHLGPDILGPDWDLQLALANLLRRPERAIGMALLDQRNLAGIGNIYRTEALFLAGVHPATPVGQVPDLQAVVEHARRLLERNKARPSQSTTGEEGFGRAHYVFERGRRPCRRCGSTIRVQEQADDLGQGQVSLLGPGAAGAPRLTYWCPVCQPA